MPAENELWYQSEPSEGVACGALALGDPVRLHTLTTHYTRHKHIMVIFSPPLKGSDLARMAAALAYSSL